MRPRAVVFLGPSLAVEEARAVLDADYRPPAKRGDIYRAAEEGADVIGLIDGVFFQSCSVAHKEILHALEKGVRVVGASSMGALRAAEMDVFGMEGIGEIYMLYHRGSLESDDEVALIFDPLTLQPLSEPLVNIRHKLGLARREGIIDSTMEDALISVARSLYFPKRTYQRMLDGAKGEVPEERLQRLRIFLEGDLPDLKKEDALQALGRIGQICGAST